MTVLKYMAMQREKIRQRHSGEEFFFQSAKEKNSPVKMEGTRSARVILEEIDGLKGLNVKERIYYAKSKNCV